MANIEREITLPNKEIFNDSVDVLWALIAPCNLRCEYCYFGDPNNHFTWTTRTAVRRDDIFRFVDTLGNTDVKKVFLAGGDPTQLQFLPDVIKRISEQGIETAISTNGILMDEELTANLAASGLKTMFFSIDSPTPEYHDAKRGKWAESITGLRTAIRLRAEKRYQYNIGVYMVVTKENVHMIPEMMEFVKNEGVDYMEYQPVSLTEDHRLYDSLDFTASKDATSEFIAQIQAAKRFQGLTIPSEIYQQVLQEVLINKTVTITNCFGGKSLFFVDPLGNIWPCPSGRRKQPEDNLGNIITSPHQDLQKLLTISDKSGFGAACSKCNRDCVCMFELTSSNVWQK